MYRHLQKSLYKGLCPKLSTNYQTDAMQFYSRNKVPYNIFYKWYKESANRMQ